MALFQAFLKEAPGLITSLFTSNTKVTTVSGERHNEKYETDYDGNYDAEYVDNALKLLGKHKGNSISTTR